PSTYGTIGSSGTTIRPPFRVMGVPSVGAFRIVKFGIRSRPRFRVSGSTQKLWKSLWKTRPRHAIAPRQIGRFERFALRWCAPRLAVPAPQLARNGPVSVRERDII